MLWDDATWIWNWNHEDQCENKNLSVYAPCQVVKNCELELESKEKRVVINMDEIFEILKQTKPIKTKMSIDEPWIYTHLRLI